jgi:hypothetical protein
MTAIRERIRALRLEASQLESAATEEDRASEYLAALGREREGVEQAIANARALGSRRERMYEPSAPFGPWVDALKTGDETAEELELRLECIRGEIRRVTP